MKPLSPALPCLLVHPKASLQTPPRRLYSAPQNSLVAEATHVTTVTRPLAPAIPPSVQRRPKAHRAPCDRGIQLIKEKRIFDHCRIGEEGDCTAAKSPSPTYGKPACKTRIRSLRHSLKGAKSETTHPSINLSHILTSTTVVTSQPKHQPARHGH